MTSRTEEQKAAEKARHAQQVAAAQKRLAAAKKKRDDDKLAAERKFWKTVKSAIDAGDLNQTEACAALDFKREHVRRSLIDYAAD